MFNDNLDGTLSLVGRRTGKGKGKLPAIVVSQEPLASADVEMKEASPPLKSSPTLPTTQDTQPTLPEIHSSPSQRSPTLTGDEPSSGATVWDSMAPYMGHQAISSIEKGGPIYRLLQLPQRRESVIEPNFKDTLKLTLECDMVAMAVYLTGVEVPHPCFRCFCRKGPFDGCVIIHPEAPVSLRTKFATCANCLYKGHDDLCGIDAVVAHGGKRSTKLPQPDLTAPTENEPPSKQVAKAWEKLLSHSDDVAARHDHQHHTMVENFSDLAVACYSEELKVDKHDKTALMPAAVVKPAVPPITATFSKVDVEKGVEYKAPSSELALVTPERRSLRLGLKATKATNATPASAPSAPSAPNVGRQSGYLPKTPITRSAPRIEQNGPNMDWASTPNTRRSSRIKTLPNRLTAEPATPTPSSAKKRKLEPRGSEKGTTGSSSSRRRFTRRDIHIGSQTPSISNSSIRKQTMPPSPSSPTFMFQLEGWELAPGKIRSGNHSRSPFQPRIPRKTK